MSLINLSNLDSDKLTLFLESFDTVLCDCDGVLWHLGNPIPDIDKSILKLKALGKKVHYVTNNSFVGLTDFCKLFKKCNLDVDPADIANPCLAIINYLKKREFTGNICALGSSDFKEQFKVSGFNVVDLEVTEAATDGLFSSSNVMKDVTRDIEKIGAVVFDVDLRLSYLKLIKVLLCLQKADVLFLVACPDKTLPLGPNLIGIGPEYFFKPIQDLTKRQPLVFGKPGMELNEFIVDRFKIVDPARTLFIGDSLDGDIEFASKCGYQTLLTLTGITNHANIENLTDAEKIPDFYIDSLGDLYGLIKTKLYL